MNEESKKNKHDNPTEQNRWLKRSFSKARSMVADADKIEDLLSQASKKLESQKSKLKDLKTDLEQLKDFISDWVSGKYRKVPVQTIIVALGALIYFLNPFDMVTDFLPMVGFLDDATLVAIAIKSIRKDLEEYRVWKKHSR